MKYLLEYYEYNKEYQDLYIKNMNKTYMDFKTLKSLYREFPSTDIFFIYSNKSKLYMTNYLSAPRWVSNIKDACRFNGIFRTKENAKLYYEDMINKYGEEFSDVVYIKKNINEVMGIFMNSEIDPYGEENWLD